MISRRNSGVSAFHSWVLLAWVVGLFGIHILVGVEVLGSITYGQTHYGVYFLGIFLAQLVRVGKMQEELVIKVPTSRWLDALSKSNKDVLILVTVLFAIVFVTKDKGISRVFLSTYLGVLWPTLVLMHRFLPYFLSGFLFGKTQRFTTILIGSVEKVNSIDSFVRDLPRSGLEVAGLVMIDGKSDVDSGIRILGNLSELANILDQHSVDQVVIVDSDKSKDWFHNVFRTCDLFGCHVMVFNFWQDYFDQPVHFTRHGIHTFFTLQDEPLQDPVNRIYKRLMDIAISLPIVVVVLPVLCIWVAIKQAKEAPGSLFYVQYRSGFQKNRFKIFKFRSMYVENDRSKESLQATEVDDRVYPFGHFIRNRSIDEFPQFINVLKGDMSVIGPRPHLVKHDSIFVESVSTYRIRHFVKPGLSGLAQVNGFRGEISGEEQIQARVKLDIAYINSWSIGLDIEIILKTISELFHPSDHAY